MRGEGELDGLAATARQMRSCRQRGRWGRGGFNTRASRVGGREGGQSKVGWGAVASATHPKLEQRCISRQHGTMWAGGQGCHSSQAHILWVIVDDTP